MKKMISIVIITFIFLSLLTAGIFADFLEDFGYRILEDGTVRIDGYAGNDTEIKIPSKLGEYDVVGVGAERKVSSYGGWFWLYHFTSVEFQEGIEYIGSASFKDCKELKTIILPNSLEWIGHKAFLNCVSLKEVTIPSKVSFVAPDVFRGCESLESVRILNSIVGDTMFCECKNLKNVYLGDNVTTIGNVAFGHCPSIETIVIPESVETIGEGAFLDCTSLKNVVFMGKNTVFRNDFESVNPYYGYSPTFGIQGNGYFDYGGNIENVYAFKGTQAHEFANNNQIAFTPVVSVKLNGEYIKADVPAIIKNDRTLVPMRAIFEALGAEVSWEDESKTVTASRNGKNISMQIGTLQMTVDNTPITNDVAPEIFFDRTLVPLRVVSESLGADVYWNETEQTAYINTK